MLKFLRGIKDCQMGATAVEYGLILALLVIAMMVAFTSVGTSSGEMWNTVSNRVNEVDNEA